MQLFQLGSKTKGWFVGDFRPTILETTAVEVGIKHYRAGDSEAAHHHKVAVELTAIVNGRVRMFEREFVPGDIVRIEPGETTAFEALTDATTVVVKMPSAANDKFPG